MSLPANATVRSARLTVRPIREADLASLMLINGDPEVTAFLPYKTWVTIDDARAWYERMQLLTTSGVGRQFVIELEPEKLIAGTILLFRYEAGSARAEIGYVLGRAYWGQGLMREALVAFCQHAFDVFGLQRIEAEVNPANAASNQLLRRLGFTCEGQLRKRWVFKGVRNDSNFYGLLEGELRP